MKKNLFTDVLSQSDLSHLKGGDGEDIFAPIPPTPPKKCNSIAPPTTKEANILDISTNTATNTIEKDNFGTTN